MATPPPGPRETRTLPTTRTTSAAGVLGHAGRVETLGDGQQRWKLPRARFRTSRATTGVGRGRNETPEMTAIRPVNRRHCLHRFESCPCHTTSELPKRRRWPFGQAGFDAPVSLHFPSTRRPADTARRFPGRWAEHAFDQPGRPGGGLGEPDGGSVALPDRMACRGQATCRTYNATVNSSNATASRLFASSSTANS